VDQKHQGDNNPPLVDQDWFLHCADAVVSAMAPRAQLPLLVTAVRVDSRKTFLRSVSLSICRPGLKARMPKAVGRAEGCLLGPGVKPESKAHTTLVAELWFETSSGSSTLATPLSTLCPVIRMLVPLFLVHNQMILHMAAEDDLGW